MKRREFQIGLMSSIVATSLPAHAQAEDDQILFEDELPPLPEDLVAFQNVPAVSDYSETTVVGTGKPTSEEVHEASTLLIAAPWGNGTKPVDVARYFLEVGQGKYGDKYKKFAREWPIRANPLIHQFFVATRTYPEGDVTPWCAAFVNWCIARSLANEPAMIGTSPQYYATRGKPFPDEILSGHTSRSAASGSFRCFPESPAPSEGDIAVWFRPGTESMTQFCGGQGHVAFFLGREGKRIRVIGGNQRDGVSNGAVTTALWPETLGTTHKLFGIRNWKKGAI